MDKNATYQFLDSCGVSYSVTEHERVFDMEELTGVDLPYPDCVAKNLFIRDDKKRQYYLITVKGDKRVDLKKFRATHDTRSLSFASENDLMAILGLEKGHVTPLGLVEDTDHKVVFYLDPDFLEGEGIIGIHPNNNTATVWLKASELITLIQGLGTEVHVGI